MTELAKPCPKVKLSEPKMVSRIHTAKMGEKSEPASYRKRGRELLPIKQSAAKMERQGESGGGALVQILCICKSK